MHLCLLGAYWHTTAKGFYIGKVGDERFDSSLLGVHWSIVEEEGELYSILSFDILWYTLLRNTLISFKEGKEDKDKE